MVVTKPYEAMPIPDCDVVVDVIIFTDSIFLTASNHWRYGESKHYPQKWPT